MTITPRAAVQQQETDQTFPFVLVVSTLGAIIALAKVWFTAV